MDTDPSWSADGTRIAFASDRSGMFDLYQMPALGGDAQRFTRSGGTSREPSWSPDGTRILFTSWQDGDSEIYTLDIASGEAIQLTRNETEDRSPVWSPDGVLIAFESEYEGQPEVVVLVVNGSDPQRLTFHEAADEDPAWSPDGRYLAFTSNRDENREIYALDVNAPEQVIRLTFDCAREMFPVFRPDVGSMLPVIPFTPLITVEGEQRINLRNGPDTTFTAEADAGPDDCLTVIGRSREIGWLLVRDQRGRELWVAAELTNFAGNWDSLPLSNRDG
jgi:Tol biopolymer transport system component